MDPEVEHSIKSRTFACPCGRKYAIDVGLLVDGERPDEMNTTIYIRKVPPVPRTRAEKTPKSERIRIRAR